MNPLATTLLVALCLPWQALAQAQSPEKVYDDRIREARAEYRVALARRIRGAKAVEVFLLKFDDVRKENIVEDDDQRFFIAPYEATTAIISRRKLGAAEMQSFLAELADQISRPEHNGGAFCHFPVHGVRIYSDDTNGESSGAKMIYSGTFCWECGNFGFEYPDSAQWLDTSKKLKEIFNQVLPIPKSEIERFNKVDSHRPKADGSSHSK